MTMRIGVMLTGPAGGDPSRIGALARHVEDVGLDAVFVGDHLAPAVPMLDSTVILATAAAATRRIRLGFGVMTLALRPVAWAAKQVASLQQVSGDRVILGVGAGGELHGRTAWDAVGVPYTERGRRTEQALTVVRDLIAGRPTTLGDTQITLRPGAQPPPIWIGGMSKAAMRRSAEHGDAWFPSMLTASAIGQASARLADLAATAGRTTPHIALGGFAALGDRVPRSDIEQHVRSLNGYGVPDDQAPLIPITGGPDQAAARLGEYAAAGVRYLVLGLHAGTWRTQCELVARARGQLA
jgi:alkanesulfonate monooxygenase SsuD/methylene tetrahydromethanopterin reductase-like flavin-dependent oxidoreductase (luciferase family)